MFLCDLGTYQHFNCCTTNCTTLFGEHQKSTKDRGHITVTQDPKYDKNNNKKIVCVCYWTRKTNNSGEIYFTLIYL